MANVLFFYQNKSDSFNASDYKQIQIKLKGKTDKERYAYLNELQDINSLFMMKEAVINHQVDFNEYVEKYGKEWVNQVLKMEYEDIVNDALIHRLIEEEDNLHSYDLFLKQVKQQYETKFNQFSIFSKIKVIQFHYTIDNIMFTGSIYPAGSSIIIKCLIRRCFAR